MGINSRIAVEFLDAQRIDYDCNKDWKPITIELLTITKGRLSFARILVKFDAL